MVLAEIGAQDIPQLLVFNKIDNLDEQHQPLQVQDVYDLDGVHTPRIFVSARNLTGLPELRQALARIATAEAPAISGGDFELGTINPISD